MEHDSQRPENDADPAAGPPSPGTGGRADGADPAISGPDGAGSGPESDAPAPFPVDGVDSPPGPWSGPPPATPPPIAEWMPLPPAGLPPESGPADSSADHAPGPWDPPPPPPPPDTESLESAWAPLPPAAPEPAAHVPPPGERLVYPIMGGAAPPRPGDTRPGATPGYRPLFGSPADESAPRPRRSGWRAAALALFSGLIGAALTAGVLYAAGVFDEPDPAEPASPGVTIVERTQTEIINSETMDVAAAVGRKVIPSIVTVEVGTGSTLDTFASFGSGSGVVYSRDGYVITNEHVVEDADRLRVVFSDGRLFFAEVVGVDVPTDLAVIKVDATDFTPIDIGSADSLAIGDAAIAVGSPLGLAGGPSLTVGVISAFNRTVQTGPDAQNDSLEGMIQTDAPITRGSSGGALVDDRGRLIGITTAVGVSDVGAEGIGFATPIEIVDRVVEEIIELGRVRPSFIGIQGQNTYETLDDGSIILSGALISAIVPGTGAETAGLRPGDVIVGINGTEIRTMTDVIVAIRRYRVDDEVEFRVQRDGEPMMLTVVLGERPPDQ